MENFVILDCDIGADDAWALLMLLKAEQLKKCKVLGVTCVNGNTTVENVAINALRVLNTVDRTDIPVYKGAHGPLLGKRLDTDFFGKDGLGDNPNYDPVDPALIKTQHAVNALYEFVCKHPKQVTLIHTGPLTNAALCLNMFPDFGDKVKNIFIMGGNTQGVGNTTQSAEFNFYADPEAAQIVLDKMPCQITILPWETCLEENSQISLDWRFDVLSAENNRITKLLDHAEKKAYSHLERKLWIPCDAILAAVYLFPVRIVKEDDMWHATVELNGTHTRGQMVLDHLKDKNKRKNVRIIEKVYAEEFKDIILWTVKQPQFNVMIV